ncbi:phosphatidylserine synthase [Pseudomonas tructae]|uniref:Phosphatidylserine synthase n=1 Tax=Pseudomonas tructae TaxID=2518644 RepID=A0A411MIS7_9PSED|nr:CDP-alcohol phosphatidyltransferase family protein [Pseudomonas tructae]QBF26753.1 phosphatidylserine synthase [Pseudomonas tructae]
MRQKAPIFPFVRFFDLANGVTALNILLSFAAVVVAHQGRLSWAASVICLAAILDFVDGHIARTWLAGDAPRRAFGKHLDSFADLLNFSVAPALVLILLLPSSLAVLAGSVLVLSGVLRLAVFAINDPDAPVGYRGLPTTYSGLLFALAFQSVAAGRVGAHDVLMLMFLIAVLQVTNLKLPKFKAVPTVAFIAIVFSLCSFLLYHA